jgi:hypothetical protein
MKIQIYVSKPPKDCVSTTATRLIKYLYNRVHFNMLTLNYAIRFAQNATWPYRESMKFFMDNRERKTVTFGVCV